MLQRAERLPLSLPRSQQAGMGLGKVCVIVAGMRDQLPCPLGQVPEKRTNYCRIKSSRRQHAECAIRSGKALFRHNAPESWLKTPQQAHLRASNPRSAVSSATAPGRLKRIAYGSNSRCPRCAQHRPEYRWKHVRMFVRVDVRKPNALGLQQRNLRCGLGFDLGITNAPGEQQFDERI